MMNVAFIDSNLPFETAQMIHEKMEELKNNAKSEFDAFLKNNGLEEKAGIIVKEDLHDAENSSSGEGGQSCSEGGLLEVYSVIGYGELEISSCQRRKWTFSCCTTRERAEKVVERLKKEGFKGQIEIIQEELPLNVIEIGDDLIQL